MKSSLFLADPPPLDPIWVAHLAEIPSAAAPPDLTTRKANYLASCRALNEKLLSSRDSHLTQNISISDVTFTVPESSYVHTYRKYSPAVGTQDTTSKSPVEVIYYHGGGLYVGDLDSEDLACRRICLELGCNVYSCSYRLMPEATPDDSLSDALALFWHLFHSKKQNGKFVLVGSSSGGQLAAQVSQEWLKWKKQQSQGTVPVGTGAAAEVRGEVQVVGVLLRCPVTCNASLGGVYLPQRFEALHNSLSPKFKGFPVEETVIDSEHRTTAKLPLEAEEGDLEGMPKHWIQLCTNDIYYSDGACYVEALQRDGVDVRVDVLSGWAHTFWLKAVELDRAVQAEQDMLHGLIWLIKYADDNPQI